MNYNALNGFHFTNGAWLWALLIIPLLWALYALFYRKGGAEPELKAFADAHLLPHLLLDEAHMSHRKKRFLSALIFWSVIWAGAICAMAGPRWGYTEVKAFRPAGTLVILLDASRSMQTEDQRPSRFERAKQEITDLSDALQGMNIGLIVYAAIPHVITPPSDDTQTLRGFLPALNPDLIYTQGGNLSLALSRAGEMLDSAAGDEKHILVISDGDFEEHDDISSTINDLAASGVRVHALGIGTPTGAPIPNGDKGYIKDENKTMILSRLNEVALRSITKEGQGDYVRGDYLNHDTTALTHSIKNEAAQADAQNAETTKYWEERFYLFLLLPLLCLLPFLRRGATFPMIFALFLCLNTQPAAAFDWRDWFSNSDVRGKRAYEDGEYDKAAKDFTNPYNRGVAEYKAGDYEAAAQSFAQSGGGNAQDAAYNLGNAQLMNGQIDAAIKSYEDLLQNNPDHKDAAHNLEIAKKLKEQQQKNQQQKEQNQDQQSSDQQNESQDQSQSDSDNSNSDPSEGEQQQDQNHEQGDSEQKDSSENSENNMPQDEEQSEQDSEPEEQQQDSDSQETNSDEKNDEQSDAQEASNAQNQERSQQDINADQWLNRIENDQAEFLRNKFYIESMRAKAQEGKKPW